MLFDARRLVAALLCVSLLMNIIPAVSAHPVDVDEPPIGPLPGSAQYSTGVWYVNGTQVAASSGGTTPQTVTYTYTPTPGDVVTIRTNPSTTGVGNRTVQSGQTTTYLTADPA